MAKAHLTSMLLATLPFKTLLLSTMRRRLRLLTTYRCLMERLMFSVTVTIDITPVNDNAPVFTVSGTVLTAREFTCNDFSWNSHSNGR